MDKAGFAIKLDVMMSEESLCQSLYGIKTNELILEMDINPKINSSYDNSINHFNISVGEEVPDYYDKERTVKQLSFDYESNSSPSLCSLSPDIGSCYKVDDNGYVETASPLDEPQLEVCHDINQRYGINSDNSSNDTVDLDDMNSLDRNYDWVSVYDLNKSSNDNQTTLYVPCGDPEFFFPQDNFRNVLHDGYLENQLTNYGHSDLTTSVNCAHSLLNLDNENSYELFSIEVEDSKKN